MKAPKLAPLTVQLRICVEVSVGVSADSMEEALEKAKAFGLDDILTLEDGVECLDQALCIKGVSKPYRDVSEGL